MLGLKNIVPLKRLKPGWTMGNIVSNGEDKSNNIIYYVRGQSEAGVYILWKNHYSPPPFKKSFPP